MIAKLNCYMYFYHLSVICAKQYCCLELWEVSEGQDCTEMLHNQDTCSGLPVVYF